METERIYLTKMTDINKNLKDKYTEQYIIDTFVVSKLQNNFNNPSSRRLNLLAHPSQSFCLHKKLAL